MAKALVVDSNAKDADLLERVLEDERLDPVVCQTSVEAGHALLKPMGHYAVIFVSADDPDGPLSGLQLVVRCRNSHPETPIVVLCSALDANLALRAFGLGARDFLERPLEESALRGWLHDLLRERDPYRSVIEDLRTASLGERGERLIGESRAFRESLRDVARVLDRDEIGVLILGEPGTGKELVAQAIHRLGLRASKPWVAINVLAIPETLVESSLFGQERGAFTDAREMKRGLLESAGEGTLFLDEIGDLALPIQGKLLRAIQEREFRRVGGNAPIQFQARLICATNRNLKRAVLDGQFRRDLYDRLAQAVIQTPPLRERAGDVVLFLEEMARSYRHGAAPLHFAKETLSILRSYPFPGNIRELQNIAEDAMNRAGSEGSDVLPRHLPFSLMSDPRTDPPPVASAPLAMVLADVLPPNWLDLPYRKAASAVEIALDRVYLARLLEKARHNITRAAAAAEMDTKTFRKHWNQAGLPALGPDEERTE